MSAEIKKISKEEIICQIKIDMQEGINKGERFNIIVGKCNEGIKEEDFKEELNETVKLLEIEDVVVDNNKNYVFDATQKIVAAMFKSYKRDLYNSKEQGGNQIEEKKKIVLDFEKVMKCIRYEILGAKSFFDKIDDNLELLMELCEVISTREALAELIEKYLKMYNKKSLLIYFKNVIDCHNVVYKEVHRTFNIQRVTLILSISIKDDNRNVEEE
ncbi:hypothetical protein [Clostridium estertheticum]|uniref:hypothetical protein n=1 Tax=Clostridium estertheticum TaxID=238834 RepID=UPI001C0CA051|nr:hypothetical protein [Clostridium estertheticum]MBU3071935.1 hypothetical protein [Clostridium estertheticum]MBU3162027.1 hypothetical protein [Clostridium estertheticum]